MAKEKITYHDLLYDFINYKALIEAQANTRTFLDDAKKNNIILNKNYNSKSKVKKLKLHNKNNYYKK